LARSLAVRGSIILEHLPAEAVESLAEAIRLLTPCFSRLPRAHAPLMQAIRGLYLEATQAANVASDTAILGPVIAVFEALNSPEHESS